jgi:ABC-type sugar transport system substrate-binding protein
MSSGAGAEDKKVVGVTLLTLESPYLVTMAKAMTAEAAKKGINLISLDPRGDVAKELSQVENLITQKVNLIIMVPVDQTSSQNAAKEVNAAGIPLMLLNTKFSDTFASNGGKVVSYVGSDDTDAGKIEGDYVAAQLHDSGNIVYLVGDYGGPATERRKAGFMSVMKDKPNLKIVTETQGHMARAAAKTIMENLLQKYPKGTIQAVVAQNDEMAIGASSAIQEAGRLDEFKVLIGVDGSPPALAAVKAGTMTATVFQDAVGQGTGAIDVASTILSGGKVDPSVVIPFKLVTKDNVASFQ